MKTRKHLYYRMVALIAIAIGFAMPAKAQMSDNGYANIDWQFNTPLNNRFADNASGWGMNFEGGYFITPNIGVGLFFNYHTNHEYIERQSFALGSGTVTTDQQHTIFQLPFGAAARYQWNRGGTVQPYISAKVGTEYTKMRSNFSIYETRDNNWGFYLSPEVGINIFPWAYGPGLHLALYYSHATNQPKVLHYHVDGLNNLGFRIGLSF